MNTNIFFVRHGHSIYSPDELNRPLSEKGNRDAGQVTKFLSTEKITHVVSSPYRRAIQTVEGTAKYFGLSISIEDGFREKKLSGNPVDDFNEAVRKSWEDFSFFLPGGESGYCAQSRGGQSIKNIVNIYSGGNIVIGTHGNIMTLIMNYYDKRYGYEFWGSLDMPDIYKLEFENVSLAEVKHIWMRQAGY